MNGSAEPVPPANQVFKANVSIANGRLRAPASDDMAAWNRLDKVKVSKRKNLLLIILPKSSKTNGPEIPGRNTRLDSAVSKIATITEIVLTGLLLEIDMDSGCRVP
ncbi:MAG: hypothetical protein ACWGOV_05470 [Acidiferrobacterales bacterium]